MSTTDELARQSESLPTVAKGLAVESQADLERAAALLQDIKALRAEIAATFDPIVEAAHKAHRSALEQRKRIEAPLIEAKALLDRRMGDYVAAVERRAREERERIERAAREERERQERLAREEREKAEADARAARAAGDAATAARAEADVRAAAELEEEAALEASVPVELPPLPAPVRVAGASFREVWKYEVTSLPELVAAVAAGKAPIEALQASEAFIGAAVRSTQGKVAWPGVRVYSVKQVATR